MANYDNRINIKSLWSQIRQNINGQFNLINPCFTKDVFGTQLSSFTVSDEHEMRIDLVMRDMYFDDLAGPEVMEHADVILFINNIDNPLNIKKGMVLIYPELKDIDRYRTSSDVVKSTNYDKNELKKKLMVPNKSTQVDKSRKDFKKNDYSVPPTVQNVPREPVTITPDGKFSIGGL